MRYLSVSANEESITIDVADILPLLFHRLRASKLAAFEARPAVRMKDGKFVKVFLPAFSTMSDSCPTFETVIPKAGVH